MALYRNFFHVLLSSIFMLLPVSAVANTKDECVNLILAAGYEPSASYSHEESGFFVKERHIFGEFTCIVGNPGQVTEVTRLDAVIVQDGFIGSAALSFRDEILEAESILVARAKSTRDAEILLARERFDSTSDEIEQKREAVLANARAGSLDKSLLNFFSIGEEASLVSNPESAPEQSSNEIKDSDMPQVQGLDFPVAAYSNVAQRNFSRAYGLISAGIENGSYSKEDIDTFTFDVLRTVRGVPSSDSQKNFEGYKLLLLLDPENAAYQSSFQKYETTIQRQASASQRGEQSAKFEWIASRLNENSTQAQREIAFDSVSGQQVLATGRVTDVTQAGWILGPIVTIRTRFQNVDVGCQLPKDISQDRLVNIQIGANFECAGTLRHYTFFMGTLISIFEND